MPTLQIDDTKFTFSISRYDMEHDWSDIAVEVENRYMKYKDFGELLERDEVDWIIETLNDLLYDKLEEERELSFLEPDITMICYPAEIITTKGGLIYCRNGHSTHDCYLDFTIHFTDNHGVYVGEAWTITLGRGEIEELLEGLEKELGRIQDEETVQVIGVSFKESVAAITWFFDDGKTQKRKFVFVRDKNGEERIGLVDYVRSYRKSKLPCPFEEVQNIIRHATEEENKKASKEWEAYWEGKL